VRLRAANARYRELGRESAASQSRGRAAASLAFLIYGDRRRTCIYFQLAFAAICGHANISGAHIHPYANVRLDASFDLIEDLKQGIIFVD
jgi:hypothetical protein